MTLKQRYDRCISVIIKYRSELPYLRRKLNTVENQKEKAIKEILYWRKKYEEEKEKNKELENVVDKLEDEIDRLTKTNHRYRVALFDHGNFQSPKDNKDKKEKGGQLGHPDTNRENQEDYKSYPRQRMFAQNCGKCGSPLSRVAATKEKILLDIVINPQIVQMILESERQWCGTCKMEVNAKNPRSLPFTEYGINTFMMVLILRFSAHASFKTISTVIELSHGLYLSKSDVSNLLSAAKIYLSCRYEKLLEAVRKGSVMYNDETGWLVGGQSAWMWIAASEDVTVYKAAESRGKGIMEDLYGGSVSFSMHDGLVSYQNSISHDKHCYCWAHFLRFCFEETIGEKNSSQAAQMRDELVKIFNLKKTCKDYPSEKLKTILLQRLEVILKIPAKTVSAAAIQKRLMVQKIGLVNSLLYTPDGTNNLAERELRPVVINKKISHGSDTFAGMETTAILGSIIQTLSKKSKKEENFIPQLQMYLTEGIKEKNQQYLHSAYFDSS